MTNLFIYRVRFAAILAALLLFSLSCVPEAESKPSHVFLRFKVKTPVSAKLRVTITGYRHSGAPWRFPRIQNEIAGGEWSEWIDLSEWKWHEKVERSGGIAEYPSLSLTVKDMERRGKVAGCEISVQLSDEASNENVVLSFSEKGDGNTIIFLAPYPLRKNAAEFETGRQMAARHAAWAKDATNGRPINIKKFPIISNIWSRYDPFFVESETATLKSLGFNTINGIDEPTRLKYESRWVGKSWLYMPDPKIAADRWNKFYSRISKSQLTTEKGRRKYDEMAYFEISDEISALNFMRTDKSRLNGWFQNYLQNEGLVKGLPAKEREKIEYPTADLFKRALPKNVDLKRRQFLFHAAKFGHYWSAKQLRFASDLIRLDFPKVKTGTLLPSHGFFGTAWGPTKIGMSYRMLDIFELVDQRSVQQLSSEDWFGLNRMYGPRFTWTGGQSFSYFNAIIRSAIAEQPIDLQALLTPSDDKYLRLKTHSALGQGAKSIYYWSYGPTFVSTENYWSDLRSEYDGIVSTNRAIEKTEDVLYPAKTVTDPVAILYSVSHDIWNNDKHAPFVEKRLLWHALRHLDIQPNFLREEDLIGGKLKSYKVLYVTDWNISRRASSAIDRWVKNGGIVYLSAGAATRDEYDSLYTPAFSRLVWGGYPAGDVIHQTSTYNERTVLPGIEPMTTATIKLNDRSFKLPVIGVRASLNPNFQAIATFEDGRPAGKVFTYGLGKVFALGFMPMLAYGKLAGFQPRTLEESWKPEPRELIKYPLSLAKVTPKATSNVPVVETNYLVGPAGSAIVLANYTYKPIDSLELTIRTDRDFSRITSAEGAMVKKISYRDGILRIKLPLGWTDIITLEE